MHRPLRRRSSVLARLLRFAAAAAVGAACGLPAVAQAQELPPQEPGVTLRTFNLGVPPTALCEMKSGTTPNVDKLMPAIDYSTEADFGAADNFLSHVLANLNVPVGGEYVFRLTSDDGSRLFVDGLLVVDHDGLHGTSSKDGSVTLTAGYHDLRVEFFEAGGGQVLKLEWQTPGSSTFTLVPTSVLSTDANVVRVTAPGSKFCEGENDRPGDGLRLDSVHPNYDLTDLRPEDFEPMVAAMDWTADGRLVLVTSGSVSPSGPVPNPEPGEVFILDGVTGATSREQVTYTKVATGLLNPMGVAVVDGSIYVTERDRLTELTPDADGDGLREHRTVAEWPYGGNFHEFAFGLLHDENYFYVNLSVAINNGGATTNPQPAANRGTSIKVDRETGEISYVAGGLRTPNGMGWGPEGELFVMDNQGAWLPSSKLVHIKQDRFFNHYTNPAGPFDDQPVSQPVLWLPQNEIANSPSNPVLLEQGPFAGQLLFGDVTYGGLQRGFIEQVDGEYQGAVFRHSAGLEAGVNRTVIGPDGAIYVGGIGEAGNWSEQGKLRYGLQKLTPNGANAFDMKAMRVVEGGFEIEYTQPLSDATVAEIAEAYQVDQWRYIPTPAYGGPKIDEEVLVITDADVSDDRKTVTLAVDGLKPGRVVHLRSPRPFTDAGGNELWNTEAWYTLNSLPGYVPPPDRGYYEAEEARLAAGATVATDHSGFSGVGFVAGFSNQGATLTFTANAEEAGTHPVHFRYANGPNPFSGTKQVSLYVNGTEVDPLVLPSTVDWKTWRFVTRQLELEAGANTITLRYEPGDDGNVNFDVLKVGEGTDICAPEAVEDGYTGLFDGTLDSLTRWRLAGGGSFGRLSDCTLRGEGGLGLLWYTEKQWEDYSLKLDWRLVKDDNSGVFVGFPNPGNDPWVAVNRGYEVQIDATDAPDRTTGAIYTFQGADPEAIAASLKPVGQWNSYEIQVAGQRIKVFLNGTLVNDFTSTDPARDIQRGHVGIQNHGSGEVVYYRNIRIKGTASGVRTYEAEVAALAGGANTSTEHPGYSGSGYVQGFGNLGARVTFSTQVDADGTYPVTLRYANGPNPFAGPKRVSLYVNGTELDPLTLPSTGTWQMWGTVTRKLDLEAGENTISIRYEPGDDGNVNIDALTVGDRMEPGTYEAEDASLSGGAGVNSNHGGYSGWGFVDKLAQLGAAATFTVDVERTGFHPLDLRYANGPNPFEGTKTVSMYVNGTELDQLALPSTGAWNAWGSVTRDVKLQAGANAITIRYEAGDDGHVNLDRLRIGDLIPDTTPPATTASVSPAPVGGWHATHPTVTLAASDDVEVASTSYRIDGGAWVTYAEPFTVTGEGHRTIEFRSTDGSGNVEEVKAVELSIDTVAPDVRFSGNAGTYTVDQTIAITCSATDPEPGSGVASTTCADVSAPAWSYALGSHTLSATATDGAGNEGEGSTTFTVTVTFASLQAVVGDLSGDPDVAEGLNDKLAAAANAKNAKTRRNLLDAFELQLTRATNAFTEEEVEVLVTLAQALR